MSNELMDTIRKEIYFLSHGELRELPIEFEQKIAEYVEKDADDLWDDSDVRIAFWNVVYDTIMAQFGPAKPSNRLELPTKLGTLFAETNPNEEFPGIWVGINRKGDDFSFNLLEVDQYGKNATLKTHVWGFREDEVWDEPILDNEADEDTLKKLDRDPD